MSHVAIAAALALDGVSTGERLVAFSLSSFANREHRAWPGTRVAAVRAGLSRSQYLAARDGLVERGLVVVAEPGGGRGHSPVIEVVFAQTGPWLEGEINADLFEAVLGHSRASGAARMLLATLAAVADDEGVVAGVATDDSRWVLEVNWDGIRAQVRVDRSRLTLRTRPAATQRASSPSSARGCAPGASCSMPTWSGWAVMVTPTSLLATPRVVALSLDR